MNEELIEVIDKVSFQQILHEKIMEKLDEVVWQAIGEMEDNFKIELITEDEEGEK